MELEGKRYTVRWEVGRGGSVLTFEGTLVRFDERTGMFVFDCGGGSKKLINREYLVDMQEAR